MPNWLPWECRHWAVYWKYKPPHIHSAQNDPGTYKLQLLHSGPSYGKCLQTADTEKRARGSSRGCYISCKIPVLPSVFTAARRQLETLLCTKRIWYFACDGTNQNILKLSPIKVLFRNFRQHKATSTCQLHRHAFRTLAHALHFKGLHFADQPVPAAIATFETDLQKQEDRLPKFIFINKSKWRQDIYFNKTKIYF